MQYKKIRSPSKYLSVAFLAYLRSNYYISPQGKEYAEDEVDSLYWEKEQEKADKYEGEIMKQDVVRVLEIRDSLDEGFEHLLKAQAVIIAAIHRTCGGCDHPDLPHDGKTGELIALLSKLTPIAHGVHTVAKGFVPDYPGEE